MKKDPAAEAETNRRSIDEAVNEARKVKVLAVQEEVLVQLERVNNALEHAKKEIAAIMRKR